MTAADPTSQEILQLPPGGGAVAASGTDFDIDMNTGTAGLSLPLVVPAGPNGIKPELTLRYHSGAGADWLGLGWSLNLPRVTLRAGRTPGGTAPQPALDGVGPLYPRIDSGWAPEVDSLGQRILGGPETGWQLIDPQDTVHALVAASVGCAVLPRLAAVSSAGVTVLPLDPEDAVPPRRLALAWHVERGGSREVTEFVSAVGRQAARVSEAVATCAASESRRRA